MGPTVEMKPSLKSFDDNESRTVWCGNLSEQVTDVVLFELFNQAGPVESTKRPKDSNGRPKSYAFIVYKHECSVPYALEVFRGTNLFNCPLYLKSRNKISHIPVLETSSQSNRRHSYPKSANKQTSDQWRTRYGSNLKQIEKCDFNYPRSSAKRPNTGLLGFNISNMPLTHDGLDVQSSNIPLHSMMDSIYGTRSIECYPQQNIQHNYLPSQNYYHQSRRDHSPRYMRPPGTPSHPYNARRHSDWGGHYIYPTNTQHHYGN